MLHTIDIWNATFEGKNKKKIDAKQFVIAQLSLLLKAKNWILLKTLYPEIDITIYRKLIIVRFVNGHRLCFWYFWEKIFPVFH